MLGVRSLPEREGQHVGRLVLTTIVSVQGVDRRVVAEQERELCVRQAEAREHALRHGADIGALHG